MVDMMNTRVWDSVAIPVVTPAGWSCDEIVTGMRALERLRGQVDAAFSLLVSALGIESRDAVAAVTRATRISSRAARQRVDVAEVVAKIPDAVNLLATGDVRAEHLAMLRPLADDVDAHALLEVATNESVDKFRKTVTKYQQDKDPKAFRERQQEQRSVTFFKADHGCTGVRIVLTPLEGEEFRNRLNQIADAQWRTDHPERAQTLGRAQRGADFAAVGRRVHGHAAGHGTVVG
jgi:Domain of unknown function (DUF222)